MLRIVPCCLLCTVLGIGLVVACSRRAPNLGAKRGSCVGWLFANFGSSGLQELLNIGRGFTSESSSIIFHVRLGYHR